MSDTPQVLLAHHLKALKLPTFLREHDRLARQCAAEGADHLRYLLRLAELELIERERRMVERRIRAAHFPTVKSLDGFDFPALPSLNKALVLELARDRAALLPLPAAPYEACETRTARVSSLSLVRYRGTDYSVPVAYGHREVVATRARGR